MSPAQKQLTGRKMVKNPPKKVFFSRPSGQLAEFVRICCATDTDKLSQLARGAKKTPFFGGFLSIFRPVPCFWALYMYMAGIF